MIHTNQLFIKELKLKLTRRSNESSLATRKSDANFSNANGIARSANDDIAHKQGHSAMANFSLVILCKKEKVFQIILYIANM